MDWAERAQNHINKAYYAKGLVRQFEMVAAHGATSYASDKPMPLLALPMFLRAQNIVELGSSFSYYPNSYGDPPDPFTVCQQEHEGLISTRILLTACNLLAYLGVKSKLTSIDIRAPGATFEGGLKLLTDAGLAQYWEPVMGTDTLDWLAGQKDLGTQIDLALVDSNHTYDQVKREMEGLLPLMAPESIIIVDDVYDTTYRHGADWIPEETDEGEAHGGEYGAVLEFLEANPEWKPEWLLRMVVLYRPGERAERPYMRAQKKRGWFSRR